VQTVGTEQSLIGQNDGLGQILGSIVRCFQSDQSLAGAALDLLRPTLSYLKIDQSHERQERRRAYQEER
jgi:hypothetical protein